ncbi:MAG: hypothetical protein V3U33_02710, partial [candidate division NC10 bacterium]
HGIGPKKALALVREHQRIEDLPKAIREQLPPDYDAIRDLFRHPPILEEYELRQGPVDPEGVVSFLCGEKDFSRERVNQILGRLRGPATHPSLESFEL